MSSLGTFRMNHLAGKRVYSATDIETLFEDPAWWESEMVYAFVLSLIRLDHNK